MKKNFCRKTILWCLVIAVTVISIGFSTASADTQSDLRNKISQLEQESSNLESKIKSLKSQGADQQKVANAFQAKINNTQAQINLCNNEIAKINGKISQNKANIEQKNREIDTNMLAFKKRLRSSYMNNTYNSTLILLGTSNFSNFLELEQLTNNVASHDRQLIQQIVSDIKELEKIQKENEALLSDQIGIRNQVVAKQQQLQAEQNEAQRLANSIANKASNLEDENADVEAQIKKAKKALEEAIRRAQPVVHRTMNASGFIWPVPGFYGVTQHFGGGHTGMDIASGGIGGAPIVAIADGVVRSDYYKSGWSAADGKWGLNSYGNYVVVDHGTHNGADYSSWYAHMASVAVSPGQEVSQGQVLGYVGNTGNVYGVTGIHLHLSIKCNGYWVNPYGYVG